MTFRDALPSDDTAIAALSAELDYTLAVDEARVRIGALAAHPDHTLLVAEADGAVVGWLHARATLGVTDLPRVEIAAMVVSAAKRGNRIGERLVTEAERWARARGITSMLVRSQVKREGAHRFYERLGYAFKKTSRVFAKALA